MQDTNKPKVTATSNQTNQIVRINQTQTEITAQKETNYTAIKLTI